MNLALNLVEDWDACGAAVHAESPTDFFGEFTSEVPTTPAYFGFINFNRTFELNKWKDPGVHVMMTCFAKEEELLLKRITTAGHISCHLRSCSSDPHGKTEVKQKWIDCVEWSRLGYSFGIKADGANPYIANVISACAH